MERVKLSRKTAREVAMMMTYEKLFGCDDTYNDVLEKSGILDEPSAADIEYASRIVNGVQANLDLIDEKIEQHSADWKISRMPKVDLSILRNAAYEIIFDNDMDNAITINEAVDLAKIYCDTRSPKFINGVLGSLSRS